MPPSGSFEVNNGNISSILNSASMTLARNMDNVIWNYLAEFQRDPSIRTRDIRNFVNKVRLNEIEFSHILLSIPTKWKSSYHRQ